MARVHLVRTLGDFFSLNPKARCSVRSVFLVDVTTMPKRVTCKRCLAILRRVKREIGK